MSSRPGPSGGAARGVLLVVVVTALVALVLWTGFDGDSSDVAAGGDGTAATTTTSVDPAGTTTTAATTTTVALPSGDTKVLVANASGVSGAAGRLGETLTGAGFTVVGATNATANQATSTVHYIEGFEAQAQSVASTLGIAATEVTLMPVPAPVSDLEDSNVLVVLGPDKAT